MARLSGLGAFKTFNLDCDGSTRSRTVSKYDKLYEAAGFGPAPRLGRMIASFIILPKRRKARRGGKKR